MSDRFLEAFDELVPAPAERGDWDDVLARAGVRRSHPRRPLLLAAAAAVLLALVATPAFGIGGALLDLIERTNVSFSGSDPAPNEIKKVFFDHMGAGSPIALSRFGQAIASETRTVGVFTVNGHRRALWVAPTTQGGYCYVLERGSGGCVARPDRARGLHLSWLQQRTSPTRFPIVGRIAGSVTIPAVTRIAAVFADGTRATVPFTWVSAPISAGFFAYDVPTDHWTAKRRLTAVLATDSNGKVLARRAFPTLRRRVGPLPATTLTTPPTPRLPPSAAAIAPAPPLQRASAGGVSVVIGSNKVVTFDTRDISPRLGAFLAGKRVSYSCFRFTREFGIPGSRGAGTDGLFALTVGLSLPGLKLPVDGCEIGVAVGHRWPDRFGSHTPVEIALTPAARRFFADRAAARDLALFVRSRRVQTLRKEAPRRAVRDLRAAYPALASSAIRIAPTATGLAFGETSATGKRFTVVVSNRRIVQENLKPYAFVF